MTPDEYMYYTEEISQNPDVPWTSTNGDLSAEIRDRLVVDGIPAELYRMGSGGYAICSSDAARATLKSRLVDLHCRKREQLLALLDECEDLASTIDQLS